MRSVIIHINIFIMIMIMIIIFIISHTRRHHGVGLYGNTLVTLIVEVNIQGNVGAKPVDD